MSVGHITTKGHADVFWSGLLLETILMSKHCTELALPLVCCRRAGPAPCWFGMARYAPTKVNLPPSYYTHILASETTDGTYLKTGSLQA